MNITYSFSQAKAPAQVPTSTPIPAKTEVTAQEKLARGFALFVGIDELQARALGLDLAQIAQALRTTLNELVPGAANETFAALAFSPANAGGRNLDVVRAALQDPKAIERLANRPTEDLPARGVVIDLSRRRLFTDGKRAELTETEFELLTLLLKNQGETLSRERLLELLHRESEAKGETFDTQAQAASHAQTQSPAHAQNPTSLRTIDVHVRRIRAKLFGYEDIIRTERGAGYRFDAHPDVLIEG